MSNVIEDMIENKLLNLHTAYIGQVLFFDGLIAKVQPLCMAKQYGKPAIKASTVEDVPVIYSARNKIDSDSQGHVVLTPLKPGDLVFCVCADRDISASRHGSISTPAIGHHSRSDSVIVGIL